ncbi:MAG: DNA/RNA nuclease SfsA [Pseudomonadota bacterium]
MRFPAPLIRGRFLTRSKRFFSTVELESGERIIAHCPNPGSMMGLLEENAEVWISPAQNPNRKLRYTWELVRIGEGLVGINTVLANRIVEEALLTDRIPGLTGYASIRREVPYGQNSRVDFLLESGDKPRCYVEVKNVTLRLKDFAAFPDAVTTRGAKHLAELANVVRSGGRAVLLYLVQREDCTGFVLAEEIDPAYVEAARVARAEGVESLCFSCRISAETIALDRALPLAFRMA